ncbi:MAG: hypothetical protein Q9195_006330 [Heterodermia aff. obscurata]
MSDITLYDLASKGRCACWSLNPWKNIAPTLQPLGLAPQPPEVAIAPYTVPAIHFPSTETYLMDSFAIAQLLETHHPEPPLNLDAEILPKVQPLVRELMIKLAPLTFPSITRNLLNPSSAESFARTRPAWLKTGSMEELGTEEKKTEAWELAKPLIAEFENILGAEAGPFVLGQEVSFADFMIVGYLHMVRRADESVFGRIGEQGPALKGLYEACAEWLERDD